MKLTIYTDGASRGNPGKASFGYLIRDNEGEILMKKGEYIGIATNNVAEYTGVLESLKTAVVLKGKDSATIDFYMDSKLVVEQLSGRYKIKNPNLLKIIIQIRELLNRFDKVEFTHIPRALNFEADELANIALDTL